MVHYVLKQEDAPGLLEFDAEPGKMICPLI